MLLNNHCFRLKVGEPILDVIDWTNCLVRSVCEPLGVAYRRSVAQSDNDIASARNWLMERSADDWARVARTRSKLSATEHQRLWRIINGLET